MEEGPAGPRSLTAASRRLRIAAALSDGNSWRSTPATADTCGVAIEVPESVA
jgi:hypothetical protein